MKLAGKTVVLTGAGNGIGRALTLQLVQGGSRVVGIDIRAAALDETHSLLDAELSEAFIPFPLDITNRQDVAALPDKLIGMVGPVDCLVNCAGMIQPFVRFAELDDATIQRVFDVNWFGTLYMTRAFLPHLIARPEAQLVNVGSMSSIAPLPGQAIYGASKAAIKLLTESLYAEYMDTNLHVTLVLPGAVSTNISQNSGIDLPSNSSASDRPRDVETADRAAHTILRAVEDNAFRVLVDKMAIDADKLYRRDPQLAVEAIARNFSGLLGD